jgi:uncharacterized protein
MVVGYGTISLRIPECHSLKEKRGVVKQVIGRLRNHFNASIAEVEDNDRHQFAKIGFSLVGNDVRLINSKMDKILNMTEEMMLAEIVDHEMEIFHQ